MPDFSAFEKLQAGECSPATAAMIGAALGALIADDSRGKGAAIGAGLGALACYIINTQSRQTEAGADVDRRYKADNQGALPAQPLVTQFDTAFNAGGIQNTFTIRLPAGLAPGSYAARTNLYVNGRHVGENRGSIRVIGTAAKN
jgi:crotonobetainyl-CoA:carnitine CoA-transferase CaiB-like acyl-CoA transferase